MYITTTGSIWTTWTSTATTTITTDIYHDWIRESTSTGSGAIYTNWINEYATIQVERAETLLRDLERQQSFEIQRQQREQEQIERHKKTTEARRKAKILLLENLNTEQVKDFKKEGFFFVKSPSGRLYRIREGRSINIDLMQGNSRTDVEKRLCAHPEIYCPNEDTMLAQKIYLEHMEQQFLLKANQYDPVRH